MEESAILQVGTCINGYVAEQAECQAPDATLLIKKSPPQDLIRTTLHGMYVINLSF